MRQRNKLLVLLVTAVTVIGAIAATSFAEKAAVPKTQDKLVLGDDEVKQLLILIGKDRNGKITKQEWMKFMEAEFDRLDENKSGELDAKELMQSRLRVSPFAKAGK